MTGEAKVTTFSKDYFAIIVSIGTAFTITMAVLYYWGYWRAFRINILEYIGLADVVKNMAIPIATSFMLILFALLGVLVLHPIITRPASKSPPSGPRPTGRIRMFLLGWTRQLTLFYLLGLFLTCTLAPASWWSVVLPLVITATLGFLIVYLSPVSNVFSNPVLASMAVMVPCTLLPLAYSQGVVNADKITSGRIFDYVVSPIDGIDVPNIATPLQRARFLGHAGDYMFFLEPAQGTIVIDKFDGKKPLRLQHFDSRTAISQAVASAPGAASAASGVGSAASASSVATASSTAASKP